MQFLKTFISNNKVVLRNILLGLYYLLAHYMLKKYQVDDHLELPYVVACWILFLLVAEPFSIRTITAHEAFKSEKKQPGLPIGIISGSFIAVARIVFRLLFLLAALPVIFPSYYFDHPATIYIIAILFFSELLTLFALAKPKKKAATPVVEKVHQFILWNISCIFLFIFDESLMRHLFYSDVGQGNSVGMIIFFSAFLFLIFYLPNRIIEIYAEWVDLRGVGAKSKYLLSIIWLYVLMLATH